MKDKVNFLYNDKELELIRNTFGGDDTLLKLIRKIFMPMTNMDFNIGGKQDDIWMQYNMREYPNKEMALIGLEARNLMVEHIERNLLRIKIIAGQGDETVEEQKTRLIRESKDSNK